MNERTNENNELNKWMVDVRKVNSWVNEWKNE